MKQRLLRFFADLRFAIAILLVIAFFSIIGTVIEQDQSIEIYKLNYPLTNPLDNVFYGHNKTSLINQAGNSRGGTNTRLESKDNYSKKLN